MNFTDLKDVVKDTIQENELQCHDTVLKSDFVKLKGIIYRVVIVLLKKFNEKFWSCQCQIHPMKQWKAIEYNPIFNAVACLITEEEFCSRVIDLKYQCLQTHHLVNGQMYVMLSNALSTGCDVSLPLEELWDKYARTRERTLSALKMSSAVRKYVHSYLRNSVFCYECTKC